MSGTLTPLGSLSIGVAMPCLAQMSGGITATLDARLPALSGQVKGMLSLAASPPSISAGANAAAAAQAQLQAQVDAGQPGVSFSLGLITGAAAKLNAQLGGIAAQGSLAAELTAALASAGVQVYAYGGDERQLGAAVISATSAGFPGGGGPSAACNALVLVVQQPETWAAFGTIFGVSSPTGLTYLGNDSLSVAVPFALAAAAGLTASVGIVTPSLTLQAAAFLSIAPSFSIQLPSLSGNLTAAIELAAQAALVITPPVLGVQVTLLGTLQAELDSLEVQAAFGLSIQALLGLGGVSLYVYSGDVASLGPALTAGVIESGPGNALLLATESGATWASMQTVFKTAA